MNPKSHESRNKTIYSSKNKVGNFSLIELAHTSDQIPLSENETQTVKFGISSMIRAVLEYLYH